MPDYTKMLYDIEVHSFEGILNYFKEGGDPNEEHDGVPLFTTMIEMYTRTPRFKECIRAFVNAGLQFQDDALISVLSDDEKKLNGVILQKPEIISTKYALFKNAYTPLTGATLLHFCAEYNSVACAKLLLGSGADINAQAGIDEYGFGGQTPIFHTVNQNNNNSAEMMDLLLDNSADLRITVKGIIWGKGYEWETWIPSVNPISYAMMGLLPQMHRKDTTIASVVSKLVKKAYGTDYTPLNVPCSYLTH
jgi:ankyrin repeat protein